MDSEDKKVNVSEEETEDATTQGEPELTPAETKQPETEAVNPELEGKEAKPKDEKSPETYEHEAEEGVTAIDDKPAAAEGFDWNQVGQNDENEDEKVTIEYDKLNLAPPDLTSIDDNEMDEVEEEIMMKYGTTVEEADRELEDIRRSMMEIAEEEGEEEGETDEPFDAEKKLRLTQGSQADHHHHHGRKSRKSRHHGSIMINPDQDEPERQSAQEGEEMNEEEELQEEIGAEGTNEEKLIVLGPNHPKMQRFQAALKAHLQKQLYLAECEAKDLQQELKQTKKERQETGANLYNLQYELARQTDILTRHEKQLEKMAVKKTDLEISVSEKKLVLTEAKEKLRNEMHKEEALIKAMKEMDMLEWCVRQAVDDYESELIVQENINEKVGKMKDQAEIDKRSQDYYLDKIMTHVERMEQSNAGIRRQIQAHLDEQKDLNTFINEASTEIEALQIEKSHLQRAWNETLSVIRARDDAFNAASEAVKQSKEQIRHRESELRYLNRIIGKEQVKHEQVTMLLKRRQAEARQLGLQLGKLEEHVAQLEEQLNMLQNLKASVETEHLRVTNQLAHMQKDLLKPRKRYEQLCNQKRELEDKILKDIQERTAMDKISSHIAKKIEKARTKTRDLECQLIKVENEMTQLTAEVEKLRTDVLKKSTSVEELEKKMAAQEQVIQDQANDLKQSEKTIQKKSNELERMNRRLQKLIEERGGDNESGPIEHEIDEIEKQITQTRNHCVELQEDWLKLQDKVVQLTTQREEIANANELIRKETFIMERKKQRLEVELLSKESHVQKLKKGIELTKSQIVRLNGKLSESQSEQTQLGRDNILMQNELVLQLKDAEMEAVEMEQEIESLEQEKEVLNAALSEAHDQCLIWEKKVKLVREVKESVKEEQENTTGALKLAIHHMKVRFHELMRVQEKLMSDLEKTVDKRDVIIQQSEYELQKANINPSKTKLNIQRNFKKMLEKNRQLIKDAKGSENDVKNTEKRIALLNERLECDAAALRNLKEIIDQSDQKITEAAISKHKNLIELILRQKKYKVLESINLSRYKPSWKGIENINEHIAESEKRCYAIAELCDILMNQFPENALQIKLIKASIFSHVP